MINHHVIGGQSHQGLSALACLYNVSMQIWKNSISLFKGYPTYNTMTLIMGSRSQIYI